MKYALLGCAVACLLVSGSAFASEELAKKNNCMTCHQLDKKAMGPSMQEIAAKYKDDAEGAKKIETAIKEGSKDAWGKMPMAAQASVSADDAKAIATWILTLAPAAEKAPAPEAQAQEAPPAPAEK
jgi:cytochrome c